MEDESIKATAHTRKEALAAVTVPWGLINAGFNLAICSGVETRIPLSAVTVTVRPKTNKEMTASFSVPFQKTMIGKQNKGKEKGKGKVCIQAKRPIRPELILVSVA